MYTIFKQVYRQLNSKITSKYYQNNLQINPDNSLHEAVCREPVCRRWVCRPIQYLVFLRKLQNLSSVLSLISGTCFGFTASNKQSMSKEQRTWGTNMFSNSYTTSPRWSHGSGFGRPNSRSNHCSEGVRTTPWPPCRTSQPQRWSQTFGNSECF